MSGRLEGNHTIAELYARLRAKIQPMLAETKLSDFEPLPEKQLFPLTGTSATITLGTDPQARSFTSTVGMPSASPEPSSAIQEARRRQREIDLATNWMEGAERGLYFDPEADPSRLHPTTLLRVDVLDEEANYLACPAQDLYEIAFLCLRQSEHFSTEDFVRSFDYFITTGTKVALSYDRQVWFRRLLAEDRGQNALIRRGNYLNVTCGLDLYYWADVGTLFVNENPYHDRILLEVETATLENDGWTLVLQCQGMSEPLRLKSQSHSRRTLFALLKNLAIAGKAEWPEESEVEIELDQDRISRYRFRNPATEPDRPVLWLATSPNGFTLVTPSPEERPQIENIEFSPFPPTVTAQWRGGEETMRLYAPALIEETVQWLLFLSITRLVRGENLPLDEVF